MWDEALVSTLTMLLNGESTYKEVVSHLFSYLHDPNTVISDMNESDEMTNLDTSDDEVSCLIFIYVS